MNIYSIAAWFVINQHCLCFSSMEKTATVQSPAKIYMVSFLEHSCFSLLIEILQLNHRDISTLEVLLTSIH